MGINQPRKKTSERISLLTLLLLIYLIKNLPTRARLVKKTRITKEVFSIMGGKDKIIAMTPLQKMLTLMLSRRKGKTSPKLSTSTIIERGITLTNVLKTQNKSQKLISVLVTSMPVTTTRAKVVEIPGANEDNKDNKYLGNITQVLCIQYPITFWQNFVAVIALLDSSSKVNIIYPTVLHKLKLSIRPVDIKV